jgi:hypothetical protein
MWSTTFDPENRLVAGDLERRWSERLKEVARLEDELRAASGGQPPAIIVVERAELLALATDLPRPLERSKRIACDAETGCACGA